MLVTPGGQFAISDSAKLKKWLADLQAGGVEGVGQPRTVFGFTHEQLDQAGKAWRRRLVLPPRDCPQLRQWSKFTPA